MHEPIPLPEPIDPHAGPSRQVVSPDIVVPHREPHKRQLRHHAGHLSEGQGVAELRVATCPGLGAGLVLAFFLAGYLLVLLKEGGGRGGGRDASGALLGLFDVQLDFDVGVEFGGVWFAFWQGEGLAR
jgi:hypothetical protein